MRKILMALLILSITGCAGWQVKTQDVLVRANNTARYFWQQAYPLIEQECVQRARKCVSEGVQTLEECPPALECVEVMEKVGDAVMAIQGAIFEAYRAIELGEEDRAQRLADEVLKNIAEVHQILRKMGVLDVQ